VHRSPKNNALMTCTVLKSSVRFYNDILKVECANIGLYRQKCRLDPFRFCGIIGLSFGSFWKPMIVDNCSRFWVIRIIPTSFFYSDTDTSWCNHLKVHKSIVFCQKRINMSAIIVLFSETKCIERHSKYIPKNRKTKWLKLSAYRFQVWIFQILIMYYLFNFLLLYIIIKNILRLHRRPAKHQTTLSLMACLPNQISREI
jgi:hypothetical protein